MYGDDEKLKNDFEKPKFTPYDHNSYQTERERGGCLSLFLVVIIAANAFQMFALCAQYSEVSRYGGSLSFIFALLFGVEAMVVACAVALWNWKAWGFYGLMLGYVISIVVALIAGSATVAGGAIVGMLILFALVNDKLSQFD